MAQAFTVPPVRATIAQWDDTDHRDAAAHLVFPIVSETHYTGPGGWNLAADFIDLGNGFRDTGGLATVTMQGVGDSM